MREEAGPCSSCLNDGPRGSGKTGSRIMKEVKTMHCPYISNSYDDPMPQYISPELVELIAQNAPLELDVFERSSQECRRSPSGRKTLQESVEGFRKGEQQKFEGAYAHDALIPSVSARSSNKKQYMSGDRHSCPEMTWNYYDRADSRAQNVKNAKRKRPKSTDARKSWSRDAQTPIQIGSSKENHNKYSITGSTADEVVSSPNSVGPVSSSIGRVQEVSGIPSSAPAPAPAVPIANYETDALIAKPWRHGMKKVKRAVTKQNPMETLSSRRKLDVDPRKQNEVKQYMKTKLAQRKKEQQMQKARADALLAARKEKQRKLDQECQALLKLQAAEAQQKLSPRPAWISEYVTLAETFRPWSSSSTGDLPLPKIPRNQEPVLLDLYTSRSTYEAAAQRSIFTGRCEQSSLTKSGTKSRSKKTKARNGEKLRAKTMSSDMFDMASPGTHPFHSLQPQTSPQKKTSLARRAKWKAKGKSPRKCNPESVYRLQWPLTCSSGPMANRSIVRRSVRTTNTGASHKETGAQTKKRSTGPSQSGFINLLHQDDCYVISALKDLEGSSRTSSDIKRLKTTTFGGETLSSEAECALKRKNSTPKQLNRELEALSSKELSPQDVGKLVHFGACAGYRKETVGTCHESLVSREEPHRSTGHAPTSPVHQRRKKRHTSHSPRTLIDQRASKVFHCRKNELLSPRNDMRSDSNAHLVDSNRSEPSSPRKHSWDETITPRVLPLKGPDSISQRNHSTNEGSADVLDFNRRDLFSPCEHIKDEGNTPRVLQFKSTESLSPRKQWKEEFSPQDPHHYRSASISPCENLSLRGNDKPQILQSIPDELPSPCTDLRDEVTLKHVRTTTFDNVNETNKHETQAMRKERMHLLRSLAEQLVKRVDAACAEKKLQDSTQILSHPTVKPLVDIDLPSNQQGGYSSKDDGIQLELKVYNQSTQTNILHHGDLSELEQAGCDIDGLKKGKRMSELISKINQQPKDSHAGSNRLLDLLAGRDLCPRESDKMDKGMTKKTPYACSSNGPYSPPTDSSSPLILPSGTKYLMERMKHNKNVEKPARKRQKEAWALPAEDIHSVINLYTQRWISRERKKSRAKCDHTQIGHGELEEETSTQSRPGTPLTEHAPEKHKFMFGSAPESSELENADPHLKVDESDCITAMKSLDTYGAHIEVSQNVPVALIMQVSSTENCADTESLLQKSISATTINPKTAENCGTKEAAGDTEARKTEVTLVQIGQMKLCQSPTSFHLRLETQKADEKYDNVPADSGGTVKSERIENIPQDSSFSLGISSGNMARQGSMAPIAPMKITYARRFRSKTVPDGASTSERIVVEFHHANVEASKVATKATKRNASPELMLSGESLSETSTTSARVKGLQGQSSEIGQCARRNRTLNTRVECEEVNQAETFESRNIVASNVLPAAPSQVITGCPEKVDSDMTCCISESERTERLARMISLTDQSEGTLRQSVTDEPPFLGEAVSLATESKGFSSMMDQNKGMLDSTLTHPSILLDKPTNLKVHTDFENEELQAGTVRKLPERKHSRSTNSKAPPSHSRLSSTTTISSHIDRSLLYENKVELLFESKEIELNMQQNHEGTGNCQQLERLPEAGPEVQLDMRQKLENTREWQLTSRRDQLEAELKKLDTEIKKTRARLQSNQSFFGTKGRKCDQRTAPAAAEQGVRAFLELNASTKLGESVTSKFGASPISVSHVCSDSGKKNPHSLFSASTSAPRRSFGRRFANSIYSDSFVTEDIEIEEEGKNSKNLDLIAGTMGKTDGDPSNLISMGPKCLSEVSKPKDQSPSNLYDPGKEISEEEHLKCRTEDEVISEGSEHSTGRIPWTKFRRTLQSEREEGILGYIPYIPFTLKTSSLRFVKDEDVDLELQELEPNWQQRGDEGVLSSGLLPAVNPQLEVGKRFANCGKDLPCEEKTFAAWKIDSGSPHKEINQGGSAVEREFVVRLRSGICSKSSSFSCVTSLHDTGSISRGMDGDNKTGDKEAVSLVDAIAAEDEAVAGHEEKCTQRLSEGDQVHGAHTLIGSTRIEVPSKVPTFSRVSEDGMVDHVFGDSTSSTRRGGTIPTLSPSTSVINIVPNLQLPHLSHRFAELKNLLEDTSSRSEDGKKEMGSFRAGEINTSPQLAQAPDAEMKVDEVVERSQSSSRRRKKLWCKASRIDSNTCHGREQFSCEHSEISDLIKESTWRLKDGEKEESKTSASNINCCFKFDESPQLPAAYNNMVGQSISNSSHGEAQMSKNIDACISFNLQYPRVPEHISDVGQADEDSQSSSRDGRRNVNMVLTGEISSSSKILQVLDKTAYESPFEHKVCVTISGSKHRPIISGDAFCEEIESDDSETLQTVAGTGSLQSQDILGSESGPGRRLWRESSKSLRSVAIETEKAQPLLERQIWSLKHSGEVSITEDALTVQLLLDDKGSCDSATNIAADSIHTAPLFEDCFALTSGARLGRTQQQTASEEINPICHQQATASPLCMTGDINNDDILEVNSALSNAGNERIDEPGITGLSFRNDSLSQNCANSTVSSPLISLGRPRDCGSKMVKALTKLSTPVLESTGGSDTESQEDLLTNSDNEEICLRVVQKSYIGPRAGILDDLEVALKTSEEKGDELRDNLVKLCQENQVQHSETQRSNSPPQNFPSKDPQKFLGARKGPDIILSRNIIHEKFTSSMPEVIDAFLTAPPDLDPARRFADQKFQRSSSVEKVEHKEAGNSISVEKGTWERLNLSAVTPDAPNPLGKMSGMETDITEETESTGENMELKDFREKNRYGNIGLVAHTVESRSLDEIQRRERRKARSPVHSGQIMTGACITSTRAASDAEWTSSSQLAKGTRHKDLLESSPRQPLNLFPSLYFNEERKIVYTPEESNVRGELEHTGSEQDEKLERDVDYLLTKEVPAGRMEFSSPLPQVEPCSKTSVKPCGVDEGLSTVALCRPREQVRFGSCDTPVDKQLRSNLTKSSDEVENVSQVVQRNDEVHKVRKMPPHSPAYLTELPSISGATESCSPSAAFTSPRTDNLDIFVSRKYMKLADTNYSYEQELEGSNKELTCELSTDFITQSIDTVWASYDESTGMPVALPGPAARSRQAATYSSSKSRENYFEQIASDADSDSLRKYDTSRNYTSRDESEFHLLAGLNKSADQTHSAMNVALKSSGVLLQNFSLTLFGGSHATSLLGETEQETGSKAGEGRRAVLSESSPEMEETVRSFILSVPDYNRVDKAQDSSCGTFRIPLSYSSLDFKPCQDEALTSKDLSSNYHSSCPRKLEEVSKEGFMTVPPSDSDDAETRSEILSLKDKEKRAEKILVSQGFSIEDGKMIDKEGASQTDREQPEEKGIGHIATTSGTALASSSQSYDTVDTLMPEEAQRLVEYFPSGGSELLARTSQIFKAISGCSGGNRNMAGLPPLDCSDHRMALRGNESPILDHASSEDFTVPSTNEETDNESANFFTGKSDQVENSEFLNPSRPDQIIALGLSEPMSLSNMESAVEIQPVGSDTEPSEASDKQRDYSNLLSLKGVDHNKVQSFPEPSVLRYRDHIANTQPPVHEVESIGWKDVKDGMGVELSGFEHEAKAPVFEPSELKEFLNSEALSLPRLTSPSAISLQVPEVGEPKIVIWTNLGGDYEAEDRSLAREYMYSPVSVAVVDCVQEESKPDVHRTSDNFFAYREDFCIHEEEKPGSLDLGTTKETTKEAEIVDNKDLSLCRLLTEETGTTSTATDLSQDSTSSLAGSGGSQNLDGTLEEMKLQAGTTRSGRQLVVVDTVTDMLLETLLAEALSDLSSPSRLSQGTSSTEVNHTPIASKTPKLKSKRRSQRGFVGVLRHYLPTGWRAVSLKHKAGLFLAVEGLRPHPLSSSSEKSSLILRSQGDIGKVFSQSPPQDDFEHCSTMHTTASETTIHLLTRREYVQSFVRKMFEVSNLLNDPSLPNWHDSDTPIGEYVYWKVLEAQACSRFDTLSEGDWFIHNKLLYDLINESLNKHYATMQQSSSTLPFPVDGDSLVLSIASKIVEHGISGAKHGPDVDRVVRKSLQEHWDNCYDEARDIVFDLAQGILCDIVDGFVLEMVQSGCGLTLRGY